MCKLLIITGALPKRNLHKALKAANQAFAKTERDGFGFIAVANGEYARGRYFEPNRFCGFGSGLPWWITGDVAEENHLPASSQTLIIHGRTATSSKKLANCHPFVHGNEALAHNGVVNWVGAPDEEPQYECDSEQFFGWLKGHSWDEAMEAWAGWGAMAHVNVKTGILTVVRDGAMLYCAKRSDGRGWVMATKADHLVAVCKAAGIRLQHTPLLLPDHKILSFSQRGGVTSVEDWHGFAERRFTSLDTQSWGDSSNEKLQTTTRKKGSRDHRGARKQGGGGHQGTWWSLDTGRFDGGPTC